MSALDPNEQSPGLDRLLRSAALANDAKPLDAPFGFDTRVVALWNAGVAPNGSRGLMIFVRRVALLALAAIFISSAAAFYEVNQDRESSEAYSNEFAIADSVIDSELPQ